MSNSTTKLDRLRSDVDEHGEVHATIADLGERDIRAGTAEFDHAAGLVTVDDGQTVQVVDVDHIVHWYPPTEF